MSVAWTMLASFVAGVAAVRLLCGDAAGAEGIGARLIVLSCFAIGLAQALRSQAGRSPGHDHASVTTNASQMRAKTLAIRAGLVALLVYPSLMQRGFPAWPTAVFNLEYLLLLPLLLLAVPRYVRWAESRMPRPDDACQRFGQALLRQVPWHWREHRQFLLAWAVKIFFIPLMYSWLIDAVEILLAFHWLWQPTVLVAGLFGFGLCIDLLLASAGYFFSSRLLGNETRSTDATWLGWLCCVICYPPLLAILRAVKQQADDVVWSDWLQPDQTVYWLWAALITLSWLVYWLSTVSFGLRFSNLSWRGLVDTGPYRYSKHPAYLSKNIYWWLHTVPFVGVSTGSDLLRNLLGLTFVSLVYYLRARTEERHLMAFAEYAAYAERMKSQGLLARCARAWQARAVSP